MNKWSYISTGNFRQPLRWSLELGNPSPNAVMLIWQAPSFHLEGNCWFTPIKQEGNSLSWRQGLLGLLKLACSRHMQTPACFLSAGHIASCTSSATQVKKPTPQHLHDGCLLTAVLREQVTTERGSTHSLPFIPISATQWDVHNKGNSSHSVSKEGRLQQSSLED